MINYIASVLEEIEKAEISIRVQRKSEQLTLFETAVAAEVLFNRHSTLAGYERYFYGILNRSSVELERRMENANVNPQGIQSEIEKAIQTLKAAQRRYFPKNDLEDWFLKVRMVGKYRSGHVPKDLIRSSVYRYLHIQRRVLIEAIKYLQFFGKHWSPVETEERALVANSTAAESQFELFDDFTAFKSNLTWSAKAIDLYELVFVLHESGAFSHRNGTAVTKKQIYEVFSSVFNVNGTYNYRRNSEIKNRKRKESSFIHKLSSVLEGTFQKYLE